MSDTKVPGDPERGKALQGPDPKGPAVMESEALFRGRSEIVIRHAGREYRLRRTRFDKLILTA